MVRYFLAAMALKGFSCSSLTRGVYRELGNSLGSKKRVHGQMPGFYLNRVNHILRIAKTYGFPKDGQRLIEVGTGWLHWEAVTTRLFFDVSGILFDVWDNRQMGGLKNYVNQLGGSLDKLDVDDAQRERALKLIAEIARVNDYHDLYNLLGFEYVLDPSGNLERFDEGSFNVAISAGVMEHIRAADASRFVHGIARLLRPCGLSIHCINIRDHLHQYDSSVSTKQYLHYPDWVWRLCFENGVQYINKVQRSDWLGYFQANDFALVEEQVEMADLSGLEIARDYQKYEADDLRCAGLNIVHRKLG